MRKAIQNFVRLVVVNLVLICLVLYFGLALITNKFPPDLRIVKEYATNFIDFRENYTKMLGRSKDYVEKNVDIDNTGKVSNEALPYPETASNSDKVEIEALSRKVYLLQSQMNRIEEQNREILKQLRK